MEFYYVQNIVKYTIFQYFSEHLSSNIIILSAHTLTYIFTEPSLLITDTANLYYKVPISHGVEMKDGIVKDACTKLGMDPVCFSSGSNWNVDGCVEAAKGGQPLRAISVSVD